MMTTINVSMPTDFYGQIKVLAKKDGFVSISEAIRFALRKVFVREELTENGFSEGEEQFILNAAREKPVEELTINPGDDIDRGLEKVISYGAKLNASQN